MMRLQHPAKMSRAVTAVVLGVSLLLAACGAGRSYGRGDQAARNGDWDAAVEHYRQAVLQEPDRTDYRIALERAMISASTRHLDQARLLEARGQLEDALREYRRAADFDPPNRQVAAKAIEIERRIRDEAEAARPRSSVSQLQAEASRQSAEPLLNPASREPLTLRFNNASIRDILNFIGTASGINVAYDRDFQDRSYSVLLDGVTLEDALRQILSANLLFYKVVNERTIMVIPDTQPKRAQYEEQVIRTFFISHADATELAQLVNTIIRVPALAVAPMIAANKTSNTITIRATSNVASIIEKMIQANDKPRAEVVVDVQILEVNRGRAKSYGLDLSSYSITGVFSPEADPRGTANNASTFSPAPFNLNTVSRGVSTADFYLAVPSAVVRFLESDSETRLIAKPQLRGAEGQKITLNLGDEIPVPSTVFTPVAQGGANVNPLTSFTYRSVGVNVEMTPRVTFEGEVILDLIVENSTRGQDVNIAGQNLPSFGTRRVNTRLRLRDGESNLLAGLLREEERHSMSGVPGIMRIPILRQLFAANDRDANQTDIVMLLTPRIVRTHELTQESVSPIFIGTQQNLGLGGPPPLIAVPDGAPAPAATEQPGVAVPQVTPAQDGGQGGQVVVPAGSGEVTVPAGSNTTPGTTTVPAPAQPQEQPGQPQGQLQGQPSVLAGGQLVVTPPAAQFSVGGGPYLVPVSITGASQISTVAVSLTYNPAVLRVRSVQEGSFMRLGGAMATFTQQVDARTGRIDIAIARSGDATGVAGAGLLAAVLFDVVGAGSADLSVTGTASSPDGAALSLDALQVPGVAAQ